MQTSAEFVILDSDEERIDVIVVEVRVIKIGARCDTLANTIEITLTDAFKHFIRTHVWIHRSRVCGRGDALRARSSAEATIEARAAGEVFRAGAVCVVIMRRTGDDARPRARWSPSRPVA